MKKLYQHPNFTRYIFLLFCIVQAVQLTSAGCSHTKPYYHPGIPEIERHDSEIESVLHYRLLLLGDGGEPKQGEPVLETPPRMGKERRCKNEYCLFRGQHVSRRNDRT